MKGMLISLRAGLKFRIGLCVDGYWLCCEAIEELLSEVMVGGDWKVEGVSF